jgi:transcriptional regulator with XRE-family HTH domain
MNETNLSLSASIVPRSLGDSFDDAPVLPPPEELNNESALSEALRSLDMPVDEELSKRFLIRVARALRQARESKGVTQGVAATRAELKQPNLSRLEAAGMRRGPTADMLLRYASAIGCDVEITLRDAAGGKVVARASSTEEARQPDATSWSPLFGFEGQNKFVRERHLEHFSRRYDLDLQEEDIQRLTALMRNLGKPRYPGFKSASSSLSWARDLVQYVVGMVASGGGSKRSLLRKFR